MKCGTYFLSLCLGLLLIASSSAKAQTSSPNSAVVPHLVNFSGKATDAKGKALSGVTGVSFAIYQDQSDGAPLWLETQNVTADSKGNYTAQLGATTMPDGLPLALFSTGDARWLGVTVNGDTEQPRVLLLSVPYALKAADAETIGGLPPSAFVLAKKGAIAPNAKATTAASMSTANNAIPANPAVTGKGVTHYLPMWDSKSDIVDSLIFQKSTAIGIGTITPAATLDVAGKGDVRDTLTLFPNGTDPTLAINGSAFKIDKAGKVTFASGQTFPGTGTVTSIGMSAPSSDFSVTGSPITGSGTIALNWTVAPSSSAIPDAIVKRDADGGFTAGVINSSLGISAVSAGSPSVIGSNASSGYGVYGSSATGAAILGRSLGSSATSDGVDGVTSSGGGSGVAGINNGGGVGVYGTGSTGVFGTGSGFGFVTDSNVQQARSAGGWAKAMLYVSGTENPTITRCFNSTLPGTAATAPPCGFTVTFIFTGSQYYFLVDFGFEVDDRFVTNGCQSSETYGCAQSIDADQVLVTGLGDFTVIVF